MPGKSVNLRFTEHLVALPTLASTVLPGKFAVALRNPQILLNNVVLPTFGLPISNTEDVEDAEVCCESDDAINYYTSLQTPQRRTSIRFVTSLESPSLVASTCTIQG